MFLLDIFPWLFPDLSGCSATYFFLASWFLDEVRSVKEVQKTSRHFIIYPSILDLFTFFYFSIFITIYVTKPIIDVYEVNNGRHHQCQSGVWAHMGIMRRRSIFEDTNRLTIIWFTIRQPQFIRKDNLNIPLNAIK